MNYTHVNPLHPPIANNHQSGFTTLDCALTGVNDTSLPSNWRRVPQDSSPRNIGSRHPQSPITFQMCGRPKVMGVGVSDLIGRNPASIPRMLIGGHDLYLQTKPGIILCIRWPGYQHSALITPITIGSGGVSRAVLGEIVAEKIKIFYDVAKYHATSNPRWSLGVQNIRLEQIVLLSLWNTHENYWQAEMAIHA
ncbi:hypothetical protein EDD18DRAFT_1441305 [Armillaria luteobubalina]|uniref:Uncharacterized protein n=1 Tax=Armillaria luteobubalina TaxID=153913 RepID=A0AA39UZI6_9AGAR|nr:hypothetical protein EDD18DRAFT_1441305 [Armillaria luteobubalina]